GSGNQRSRRRMSRDWRSIAKEWRSELHVWNRLRGIERRNPVLVYQMGKVGSSSVVNALEDLGEEPVLHCHTLTRRGVAHAVQRQRRSVSPGLPEHLLVSRQLQGRIGRLRRPLRIVTLTREPFA